MYLAKGIKIGLLKNYMSIFYKVRSGPKSGFVKPEKCLYNLIESSECLYFLGGCDWLRRDVAVLDGAGQVGIGARGQDVNRTWHRKSRKSGIRQNNVRDCV